MARLSVCIEMIFKPLAIEERIDAVAQSGCPAFEFWRWQDKDLARIGEKKDQHGLKLAAFGAAGGTLLDPGNHQQYWDTFAKAAEWARKLECPNLIVTTGNTLPDVRRAVQMDALRRGLEGVAKAAKQGGVAAVLEPLNTKVNHPGYFLDHAAEAFQLIDEIGSPSLRILYDIYHMQIMDGDIIQTIKDNVDRIGHFHVADVPGRHEPGTGELNYANIIQAIDATGFGGFVGLEYHPSADHAESLRHARSLAA